MTGNHLIVALVKFHEFNRFLSEEINEKYQDAELVMIKGGDCVRDIEMEVRSCKSNIPYKPYELYQEGCASNNFEEVIGRILGRMHDE